MPFLTALLDALSPALCVLCRSPPGALPWLCETCLARLDVLRGACCLRCGAPCPLPVPVCARCPDWPRRLVAARSGAAHHGSARELVHALKYTRCLAAARPLGALACAAARELPLPAGTLVVPVPLHWRRFRQRGLNQAHEIARVVARDLGLRLHARLLRRVRWSAGSWDRTPSGRAREARGAFRVRSPPWRWRKRGIGEDSTVLLVDDVLTTGATLGACARVLVRAGVREVWAATATRGR